MGAHSPVIGPLRRDEALAFIIDRITQSGISPSYDDIARAMKPRISRTRAKQLVDELVERGALEREPSSRRGIRVRDLVQCREVIERALQQNGWWHAKPLGDLEPPTPCTFGQLPTLPPFEHLPDIE